MKIFLLILFAVLMSSIDAFNFGNPSPTGAVVTNGPACAKIGASILKKGGNAVDAAVAVLFCEGVSVPNCMGLGGGFLMNIYIKETGTNVFLNSREVAPLAATEDMFGDDPNAAIKGGISVAVPAELKGYWEVYNKYGGGVSWKDLVQPTIDLCNEGILVTSYLEKSFVDQRDVIFNDPYLRETFIDPETNDTYVQNQVIKQPRLAKTLELFAEFGADALYNGTLTKDFVKDIQDQGGIITEEDLNNYKPKWKEPYKIELSANQTLFLPPLPTSGAILGLIINILNGFLDSTQPMSITNWERIIESYKFGYGHRTKLGDIDSEEMEDIINELLSSELAEQLRNEILDDQTFQDPNHYGANGNQKEDHGTANTCVLSPNGDAVVVTSTINLEFGAGFMSPSTGIILNDEMDDFSSPKFNNSFGVPPQKNNYIKPGKSPMSSMSPSILLDNDGEVRLLIGGSGGIKIINEVASVFIKHLWFNYTIKDAVADSRLYHELFPMQIHFEKDFDTAMIEALHQIGHEYDLIDSSDGFNTVTAISRENGEIKGSFDPRRGGGEEYVYNTYKHV